MSGHSKWHSIKHAKGAADAARGRLFARLARQIEVAAREGGGDIEANPTLRTMVHKARDNSMPKDNIERAIKRGTGELEGVRYEAVNYEGYAPHGVAIYVETLTDNRNRTGAEIKNIFSKSGGSLAEPGAVSWQFERKGLLYVDGNVPEDDVMAVAIDAGAEDILRDGDRWEIKTPAGDFSAVREALIAGGMPPLATELTMISENVVELADAAAAGSVMRVIDLLEENDDVNNVYSNVSLSEALLKEMTT